jgi:hypothetical protein
MHKGIARVDVEMCKHSSKFKVQGSKFKPADQDLLSKTWNINYEFIYIWGLSFLTCADN